jgi:regulator of PEP synthase PpsR (kinase-PPPase family)
MALTRFHLHLVSDSTGDTVHSVARACLVQFDETQAIEHVWSMVRTRAQIERVVAGIEANPGVVLFTMVDNALRQVLQDGCRRLQVPAIPVLDPVLGALAAYLGREVRGLPGKQHLLDKEYFARIDAMTFAINHDDGQAPWGINDADVCLVGVSRTSKTPTCLYLANRGIKAANIPLVPGVALPPFVEKLRHPLVVGLIASPERIVQIRQNRLLALNAEQESPYVDRMAVAAEIAHSKRLFAERGWPMIDVTRRSIEETAAAILDLYRDHRMRFIAE